MKRITLEEIKQSLAKDAGDNIEWWKEDLEELFLYGIKGFNDYSVEDLMDAYIASSLAEVDMRQDPQEEEFQVGEVVNSDGVVIYRILQEDGNFSAEKLGE